MKKAIIVLISALLLISLCSCQTDFTRPADYLFDAKNRERIYSIDLSGMNRPGTSKTFVFEVKNTSNSEKAYTLTALSEGNIPLICEFARENDNTETPSGSTATGSIGKNEKHRYTLTVSWRAEENGYIYAGGTASITVEGFAE